MNISVLVSELYPCLSKAIGAVERRQTLSILNNLLVETHGQSLNLTATDLEIEIETSCHAESADDASRFTVPARKFFDICRNLSSESVLEIKIENERVQLYSGRSRFQLSTLPADDFPRLERFEPQFSFALDGVTLHELIDATSFAMALQDVRYYLNGLLLECAVDRIHAVATDGHRLSKRSAPTPYGQRFESPCSVIVPRKTVLELSRLLKEQEGEIKILVGANSIEFSWTQTRLVSKLIDGRFPDYERVIPRDNDHVATFERETFKAALQRVSILSNEKFKGVRLSIQPDVMALVTNNPEHDEAVEELPIDYQGEKIDIGFNLNYLFDVINAVSGERLQLTFKNSTASALLTDPEVPDALHVVMPMRL